MILDQNAYKLILLDTNAIREIITNTNLSGKGFFQKFFSRQPLYAPCFSINNVFELMPYKDIYEQFLEFFNMIPCFMFYPVKMIIQEEFSQYTNGKTLQITNQVAQAFSPLNNNESYNCREFFEKMKDNQFLTKTIQQDILGMTSIAQSWESQRKVNQINSYDDQTYKTHENEAIIKDLRNWGIKADNDIDISKLPTLRIMEYSQYCRVHQTKKPIKPNDVMDIKISCIIPYLDAVITEGFQANVYRKAKKFIPQLRFLEVYILEDIRL